jgi:hypothetical protein
VVVVGGRDSKKTTPQNFPRNQIELNRPMKGVSLRRVNHTELKSKIAPSGQSLVARAAHLLARGVNFIS